MSTTGIVVTACFISLGIYDMIVVMRKGVGCSISRFMQRVGFKSPIVCVVIGMLLGHFFMYMPPECPEKEEASTEKSSPVKIEPVPDPLFKASDSRHEDTLWSIITQTGSSM